MKTQLRELRLWPCMQSVLKACWVHSLGSPPPFEKEGLFLFLSGAFAAFSLFLPLSLSPWGLTSLLSMSGSVLMLQTHFCKSPTAPCTVCVCTCMCGGGGSLCSHERKDEQDDHLSEHCVCIDVCVYSFVFLSAWVRVCWDCICVFVDITSELACLCADGFAKPHEVSFALVYLWVECWWFPQWAQGR